VYTFKIGTGAQLATAALRPAGPLAPQLAREPTPPVVAEPTRSAIVQIGTLPAELSEASGLVTSRRHPNVMWAHNDSDHAGVVYALRLNGELMASVTIENAGHYDWEDIARVDVGDQSYLALCDTGDNLMERETCVIHLLPEPDPSAGDQTLTPPVSIHFRYPDGPHDVEAVAADGDRLLLLSKRDHPPVLYEVRLDGGDDVQLARRLGPVPSIPPTPISVAARKPKWNSQPTGMDIDPQGRRMVVLTYSQLCLYERRAGESWIEALQRQPASLPMPANQPQAEAVGFSRDGRALYLTSEGRGAPIHRIEL